MVVGCESSRQSVSPIAEQHTWLQSSSHEVVLGLCDKNGDGDFPALFIVTGPDGRVHKVLPEFTDDKRKTSQENHAAAYVSFPSDFKTDWLVGRYTWKCFVESNCAASGAFEYQYGSNSWIVTIKP